MKSSKDVLSSVLKTTQMGQVGIRAVLKCDINGAICSALQDQLSVYDKIEDEAHALAAEKGWELEELNPTVKKMAEMMARTRLSCGYVNSKTAAMMIQGNTRGLIKGFKNLNHYDKCDPKITSLAHRLIACEEENIRQMQGFV